MYRLTFLAAFPLYNSITTTGTTLGIEKSVDCCFDFRGFEGGERFVADVDAVDEEEDVVVGEGDGFLVHHQREEDNKAVAVDKSFNC